MSQSAVVERQLDKTTNSVSPINRLPTEILVTIFEESIYTPELDISEVPHIQKLHKLACVCLKWSMTIKETPSLWTVLESTTPKYLIPHILQRSSQSSLVIKCCGVADQQADSGFSAAYLQAEELWTTIKAFLIIVFREIHRWRSALIRLSQADSEILEGLERPAPLIKMVDINIDEYPQQESIILFAGQASNLRTVCLSGLSFMSSPGQYPDLQHLNISTTPSGQLTLKDVLMTIKSAPYLQTLRLQFLQMPVSQGEDGLGTFALNFLETLSLSGVSPPVIQAILTRIQAPALQQLTILPGHDGGGDSSWQFIKCIPHFLPMIHSSINHASAVDISLSQRSVNIRTPLNHSDPHPHIEISIDHNSSAHALYIFLRNIIHHSISHTPIRLCIPQVPEIEWGDFCEILSSLDRVVELSTEERRGNYRRDLFRFLSAPLTESGRKKWPFPNLQKLVLPSNTSGGQVVQLVKARYGSGMWNNRAGGRARGAPCSLTTLDVGRVDLTPTQYAEIGKIVGYGVVRGEFGYSYIFDS
ncbi:hypothetical protein FRC01_013754 [Tulasnella sp. 417]|nr:hypothetical protein FRC01_013754 [Tulasnella sp. 417]